MKYIYTLLLIVISLQLHAQRNFKPGYIVTLSGDTTKGFIDYKEWGLNPADINFSVNGQGVAILYSVKNIKAFGVNAFEHYRAYNVAISKNRIETSALTNVMDTSTRTETVFLRIITSGKNATLFQFIDNLKERFYIAEGNSLPLELRRYRYYDRQEVNKVIVANTFTQQLQRLVATYQPGNSALINQVLRADYAENDLKKVVFAINGSEELAKTASNNRWSSRFFIGAAANITQYAFGNLGNNDSDRAIAAPAQTNTVPYVTAGINVYFNKNVKRFILRTELGFMGTNKVNFVNTEYVSGSNPPQKGYESRLTFNINTVSLTPQLIYNAFNSDNIKAYVGGGVMLNLNFYSNHHLHRDYYTSGNLNSSYDRPDILPGFNISGLGKVGVATNRFDFYAGVSPSNNIGSYSIYATSYRFGINYLLGKN